MLLFSDVIVLTQHQTDTTNLSKMLCQTIIHSVKIPVNQMSFIGSGHENQDISHYFLSFI